jgi:hypothetical protein
VTYDPTFPAPILDDHARRIRAYLDEHGGTATARELADELGIPRKSFNNDYLTNRLAPLGVERTGGSGRGRRRILVSFRLIDRMDGDL